MKIVKLNQDNLSNINTGLGTEYSSQRNTFFDAHLAINPDDRDIFSILYRTLWQVQKVCDYFPSEMTKEWGKLTITSSRKNQKELTQLTDSLRDIFREGQKIANLYGSAMAVIYIEDGGKLSDPINLDKIKSFEGYSRIFDRWELIIDPRSYIKNEPYQPEYYRLLSYSQDQRLPNNISIHKDRILRFRGKQLPPYEQILNQGWEDSVLQTFIHPLKNYLAGYQHVTEALKDFEVMIVKIQDLNEKLAASEQGYTALKQRAKEVSINASSQRGLWMDKDTEEVTILSRNFSNVEKIVDISLREMIGSSGIDPGEFYKEKDQIKANSKEERLATANRIRSLQEEKWGKLIESQLDLILAPYKIKKSNRKWEWRSTYSPTEMEKLEMENTESVTLERYINNGVLNAEEVRLSIFDNPDNKIMLNETDETKVLKENEKSKEVDPQKIVEKEVRKTEKKKDGQDKLIDKFEIEGELLPNSYYEIDIKDLETIEED
jgi:phage-related protein (TIGR01555 family)